MVGLGVFFGYALRRRRLGVVEETAGDLLCRGDGLSTGVDSRASLTLNRGQRLGVPSVNVAEGSAFAAQARCQLPGSRPGACPGCEISVRLESAADNHNRPRT